MCCKQSFCGVLEEMRPGGTQLDPKEMSWKSIGRHTDEELKALWAYLQTAGPVSVEE